MKLNLPQQVAATKTSSPSKPRKLMKVLSTLPNANMGELTRQTFYLLRDQNRQAMPYKHRLENLEMLRIPAREIFNNLQKYFTNRALPLADKSQKIINLNQSLLQELIHGYEIIANQAADTSGKKVDNSTLTTAICRSINYLSEMLLRASEVYAPCPKNLWRDVHQLYMLAESKRLLNKTVINQEREIEKTTIGNSYKQILLFSLARPTALRQSDSDRVYRELFKWSQYATIRSEAVEGMIDRVFCIQTNRDLAPHYLNKATLAKNGSIRILDTKKLISHITSLATDRSNEKQKFILGDDISPETLAILINSWAESPKRRFSRATRHGHINVAIGLSTICQAMNKQLKTETPYTAFSKYRFVQTSTTSKATPIDERHDFFQTTEDQKEDSNFSLQSIENDGQQNHLRHSALDIDEENAWDLVAKGRVLTQAYEKNRQFIDEELIEQHQQNADAHWQVVNISAGGYCLRWNSDSTSKAQIGELIALQGFDTHYAVKWHIGVIRWMQFTKKDGLEIGVQILSPQVTTATVQRANHLDEAPFDCLILPEIKALDQTSTTLLPSHAFKTNAKLIVQVFEHELDITLGEIKEHTGSFTQFAYNNTELGQQANKENTIKYKDDFDELWSSL